MGPNRGQIYQWSNENGSRNPIKSNENGSRDPQKGQKTSKMKSEEKRTGCAPPIRPENVSGSITVSETSYSVS